MPYGISLFFNVVVIPIISPTNKITIVQICSDMLQPFQPKLTSSVEALAIVATVIHPK